MRLRFSGMLILFATLVPAVSSSAAPAAKAEFEKVSHQFWTQYFQQCGPSYFRHAAATQDSPEEIVEMKGVKFSNSLDKLSEADKLNGIAWKGKLYAEWSAQRTRDTIGAAWQPWTSDWLSDREGFDVSFQNNQLVWNEVAKRHLARAVKSSCADLQNH